MQGSRYINIIRAMAQKYLYINSRDDLIRLDCSKVAFMEGDGNYTHIVLTNKLKSTICMNLSDMQKLISDSLKERAAIFARIGKRHIINIQYIYRIIPMQQSLVLTDGKTFSFQLKISKEALKQLKMMIVNNVKGKTNK